MSGWLNSAFSFVCGQDPLHTWAPGGELLPFCQRCTGFYAGAAIALVLQGALWMRPGARFLQVHGAFLLLMVPFGFHWLPQAPLVRTLLGLLYGVGLVSYLWLWPGVRLGAIRAPSRLKLAVYALSVLMGLLVVPLLAARGGRAAAFALVTVALLGVGGIGALVVANLAIGLRWVGSRFTRHWTRAAP